MTQQSEKLLTAEEFWIHYAHNKFPEYELVKGGAGRDGASRWNPRRELLLILWLCFTPMFAKITWDG